MEDFISRHEHEEFCKRMEDEHERLSKRITIIEDITRQVSSLTTSVEKLACNMSHMLTEQQRQGMRLDTLEQKPTKRYDTIVTVIITALLTGVITYILSNIL